MNQFEDEFKVHAKPQVPFPSVLRLSKGQFATRSHSRGLEVFELKWTVRC